MDVWISGCGRGLGQEDFQMGAAKNDRKHVDLCVWEP